MFPNSWKDTIVATHCCLCVIAHLGKTSLRGTPGIPTSAIVVTRYIILLTLLEPGDVPTTQISRFMGPTLGHTWGPPGPRWAQWPQVGPKVGPMNLAIWEVMLTGSRDRMIVNFDSGFFQVENTLGNVTKWKKSNMNYSECVIYALTVFYFLCIIHPFQFVLANLPMTQNCRVSHLDVPNEMHWCMLSW